MTLVFLAIVLAVFAGGISLWLSGLLLGRRSRAQTPATDIAPELEKMRTERARLESMLSGARSRLDEIETRNSRAEDAKSSAEAELARAAVELGRVEGEMVRAQAEMVRLKEENEGLKSVTDKGRRQVPAAPANGDPVEKRPHAGANEELDFALAQLDMERVAHQKTRKELEQTRKGGGAVQVSDGRPSSVPPLPPGVGIPGRRGAGFQTVSIASRGMQVPSADYEKLRQLTDQLKRDKEKAETELARAQQELQLLKMRQQQ
jgi:hypothetical protein